MYDKKTKLASGKASETSFRTFLRQAVQETGSQPITGAQTEDVIESGKMSDALASAFAERMKEGIQKRLERDADYQKNPSRFPSCSKLFKP